MSEKQKSTLPEKSAPVKKSVKSTSKIAGQVSSFLRNKNVRYTVLAVFVIIVAFLVQYFVNKPNFGTFLSSDMDSMGNVYVLGADSDSGQYKVTKISKSGAKKFSINLDKSTDKAQYSYSNLEADAKGNFYFVKQQKNPQAVASDKSQYPIVNENIMMYDTNGNFIKQIVSIDFSKEASPPTSSYIQKIQLINQSMTVIAARGNSYDIILANPLADESPKKSRTFTVMPPTQTSDADLNFVSDMCVLPTGRVFYSTKNGELWGMNNDGSFMEYSGAVSASKFLISGMSVDSSGNIYFTDMLSGTFYKLDTASVVSSSVFTIDSVINERADIRVRDVRRIKALDTGDFYAPSKAFDKAYHVRFGSSDNYMISDLRGSFFPWGALIMLAVCALAAGIFYAVRYIGRTELKRVPLGIRIISMFLPVYVLAMATLVYINTSDSVTEYMSVLKSEHERGAKTAADSITGSDFSKLDHVSDYMSADYIKMHKSIEEGYKDIALKIGDRSDYLIAYVEKGDKLYTTLNTRYEVSSSSYDKLRYADPDMASSQCALVDCVLERDESEAIYSVWNQFSDKSNEADSLEAKFRDVNGNMSASFVAIKDTNGRVVGFVGNFLNDEIHSSQEFWRIFKHAMAVIFIITVLVFVYICFVVKWCLRPLKKIENAINNMSKGRWNERVRVDSKDELADIAQAFNIMSEKIDRYTSNLITLNKEYIRYVPTEVFRFMNKEKITQVKLYDNNVVDMNLLYVTFNISCKGSYDFKDEQDIFEALNTTYKEMFKVVETNKGVVQSFDGLDMLVLFPGDSKDAFNAAVQFKEIKVNPIIKEHMNITLGSGNVLVGVSGNDDRRGVVVVSDEVMQMFNIDTQLNAIGIDHAATKPIIDKLGDNHPYSYRFIGRIGSITGEGFSEIYEIIDGSNKYKKDLYMSTKENFESGVEKYLMSDFAEARRIFTDVLRVNENDKAAIYYLMKCEQETNRQTASGRAYKGFTGYLA